MYVKEETVLLGWVALPFATLPTCIAAFYLALNDEIGLSIAVMLVALMMLFMLSVLTEILLFFGSGAGKPPPDRKEPIPNAPQKCGAFFHSAFTVCCV